MIVISEKMYLTKRRDHEQEELDAKVLAALEPVLEQFKQAIDEARAAGATTDDLRPHLEAAIADLNRRDGVSDGVKQAMAVRFREVVLATNPAPEGRQ